MEKESGTGNTGWVAVTTQLYTVTPLTDAATVTWALSGYQDVTGVVTLAGNRTLAFTGATAGLRGTLIVKQDATGGRTLALPAGSKVVDGGVGVITLSVSPNSVDILSFIYDGTNYYWFYGKNFL